MYREVVKIGTKVCLKDCVEVRSTAWMFNLGGKLLIKYPEVTAQNEFLYKDGVRAKVSPTYGPYDWRLPQQLLSLESTHALFYRVLTKLLLEGHLFSALKGLKYSIKTA